MEIRRADDVPDTFREIFNLTEWDAKTADGRNARYYFRGERCNFKNPGSTMPPCEPPLPGVYRNDQWIENESYIFNEAIRTFPDQFRNDRTTFEKLTRMQHYGYATRLLDVTPKIATALAMVLQPDGKGDTHMDETGFIHVYRVRKDRIKYSTGDTVTALANLARIKPDHVHVKDLRYLAYECQNERAGFHWEIEGERDGDGLKVSEQLCRDIQQVWCIRPVINNPRIDFQVGEFFIFGCRDRKEKLETTFYESDYRSRGCATEGIARIGVVALSPYAKKDAVNHSEALDIGLERIYPDFHYHSQVINERAENE